MNKDLNKKEIENTIKSLDKLIKEAKKQAVYTKICFYLSVVSVLIVVFEGCLNTSNNIINKIDMQNYFFWSRNWGYKRKEFFYEIQSE